MRRETEDLIVVGALALGGFLVYRMLGSYLSKVAAPAVKSLAQAWVWATSPAQVQATGNIVLPSGQTISATDIQQSWFSGNTMRFTYAGQDYLIEQNPSGGPAWDTSGDYHAQAVQ